MTTYSAHIFLTEEEAELVEQLLESPEDLPEGLIPILDHINFWKEIVE